MPGVSGLGFLAIKYLRNTTVATYARDMLYSFVESQIMAMPEEQAAAIEALAEGKGSGDTMPITEEEMEEFLRMGTEKDLKFRVPGSARDQAVDRALLRERGLHFKKDKENQDENQDDDWLDFACDLTEKDTLEQVLGLYYKKHNKEKTAEDAAYIAGKYTNNPIKLIRMLEKKYGDHLMDFCPNEDGDEGGGDTGAEANQGAAWWGAWSADLHPAYKWAAAVVLVAALLMALFGAPLRQQKELAGRLDVAGVLLLAVGAAAMSPTQHATNAAVLALGGVHASFVVVRTLQARWDNRPKSMKQRRKEASQMRRREWLNF